jgi:ATP-binding cassette subfamily B protein
MSKRSYTKIIDNNAFILKLIWKASPARIFLNLLFIIISRVIHFLFFVLLLRYILNSFSTGIHASQVLLVIVIIGTLKIAFSIFENYFWQIYVPISDQNIYQHIQNLLFKKATEVDISCYEDPEFYDQYVKAMSEVNVRAKAVLESISDFVGILSYISLTTYVIFTIDPIMFSFVFIPIIAGGIIGKINNKINHKFNMEKLEIERKRDYTRRILYLKDYAKEIRLTNINRVLFRRFSESVKEIIQLIKKYGFKLAVLQYLFFLSNEVLTDTLVFFYASYKTMITKTMLLGDFFVVIDSMGDVAWSFREIVDIYMSFEAHSLYIDNLRSFLGYVPKINKNEYGPEIKTLKCDLKLDNVSFAYHDQNYVLKNISLEVKHGQKIALVGNNGVGKTTLVKLIMRLYDTSQGVIYLNGEDIKKYNLDSYRSVFKPVFQDYKIFSLSVAENVLLSEVNTPEQHKAVTDSLMASGIYDKVRHLKNEFNTTLTREFDEQGVELSGGEAQKIALSRVLAQPCSIVILDEPSSALDPISEYKMFETMLKICKNKTVIFISHRLSSTVMVDKIFLLKEGEIIEEGNHKELMLHNGEYADMFRKQAEKYLDDEEVTI